MEIQALEQRLSDNSLNQNEDEDSEDRNDDCSSS